MSHLPMKQAIYGQMNRNVSSILITRSTFVNTLKVIELMESHGVFVG